MAEGNREPGMQQENRLAKFKSLELFELFSGAAEKAFLNIYSEKTTILEKKAGLEGYLEKLVGGLEVDNRALLDILATVEFGNRFVSHSLKVTVLAVILGKKLDVAERRLGNLALAAFLHDIGKARTPNKDLASYFKNMHDEQEIHTHHPEVGAAIALEYFGFPGEVGQMIRRHHEQPDGKGFPDGLSGTRLTLPDKILFTANFIDNILFKSGYTGVENVRQVMKNIIEKYAEKFDISVINAIIELTSKPVVSNRAFERVSISLPCTFRMWQSSQAWPGRILDLSAGGALLRSKTQLDPGMLVRVSFSLPGVISIQDKEAEVVRRDVDDRGFVYGLRFEEERGAGVDKLAGYINKYFNKPAE